MPGDAKSKSVKGQTYFLVDIWNTPLEIREVIYEGFYGYARNYRDNKTGHTYPISTGCGDGEISYVHYTKKKALSHLLFIIEEERKDLDKAELVARTQLEEMK